jgi:predicted RNA-binding Zn-ribbon protein involved in translation (DUF1610 family)
MESLNCNSCGASLQAPNGANYLTCNHCGQTLAVRRTESATFTEAIDRLNETTTSLREQVANLSRQSRLADLDRRWELEREEYMVSGKDGSRQLPTAGGSLVGGVVIVLFGTFWTIMASRASPFLALFGVVFVLFGVGTSIHSFQKSGGYAEAWRRYQAERARIEEEEG